MAQIQIKIVQAGQEEITERLNPPCTVAEALDAIKLTGKLQDAQGTTLRATETLSAGHYTLHTQVPAGVLPTSESQRQLSELYQDMKKREKKDGTVAMSDFNRTDFNDVQTYAKIKLRVAEEPPVSVSDKRIPAFQWDDRSEPAQHDRYMTHILQELPVNGRKDQWLDARRSPNFLNVNSACTLGKNLRGTCDAAVSSRAAIRAGVPQEDLKLLLELKKDPLQPQYVFQARAILLAANTLSPASRPCVVLTDLNDRWTLFYMENLTIITHPFNSRNAAAGFICHYLKSHSQTTGQSEGDTKFPEAFWKRQTIDSSVNLWSAQGTDVGDLHTLGNVTGAEMRQAQFNSLMTALYSMPSAPLPPPTSPPFGMYM